MEHRTLLIIGILLSLAANGVLGAVAVNHLGLIDDLEAEKDAVQNDVGNVESDLADLRTTVQAQQRRLSGLEARPAVNIEALAGLISDLQEQVDQQESAISDHAFRIDDIEFQISRPSSCFGGDVVYWATGFQTGFTC